jgi:hypothetical protein
VSNLHVKQSGANASVWSSKEDGAAITVVGLEAGSITGLSLTDVTVDRYTTAVQCSQAHVSIGSVVPHFISNSSVGCVVHGMWVHSSKGESRS